MKATLEEYSFKARDNAYNKMTKGIKFRIL